MKAIQTRYAGCQFRSRIEARWAVFFDTLGVQWQYEPEGFELPSGRRYLPDFYLPESRAWFEVKGTTPSAEERATLIEFAANLPRPSGDSHAAHRSSEALTTSQYLKVAVGDIPRPMDKHSIEYLGSEPEPWSPGWIWRVLASPDGWSSVGARWWVRCPRMHVWVGYGWCWRCPVADENIATFSPIAPAINAAYLSARQARFEYGQTPPVGSR